MELSEDTVRRFWSHVNKDGPIAVSELGPCWIWMKGIDQDGYGQTSIQHKTTRSHRASWMISRGESPSLNVLHKCDVRRCVRPSHLFLGTQQENHADMVKKGRNAKGIKHGSYIHIEQRPRGDAHYSRREPNRLARGERHGSRTHPEAILRGESNVTSKLTNDKVTEIRRLSASGMSGYAIAKLFSLSDAHVLRIVKRQSWAHI